MKRHYLVVLVCVALQHHCRNCGAVVCGPCSSKKFLLPQQSSKPVRVCLDCYDSLSQTKNEQVCLFAIAMCVTSTYLALILQNKSNLNPKSNNNPALDSSAEEDSDDDEDPKETHDEVSAPPPRRTKCAGQMPCPEMCRSLSLSLYLTTDPYNSHITNNSRTPPHSHCPIARALAAATVSKSLHAHLTSDRRRSLSLRSQTLHGDVDGLVVLVGGVVALRSPVVASRPSAIALRGGGRRRQQRCALDV